MRKGLRDGAPTHAFGDTVFCPSGHGRPAPLPTQGGPLGTICTRGERPRLPDPPASPGPDGAPSGPAPAAPLGPPGRKQGSGQPPARSLPDPGLSSDGGKPGGGPPVQPKISLGTTEGASQIRGWQQTKGQLAGPPRQGPQRRAGSGQAARRVGAPLPEQLQRPALPHAGMPLREREPPGNSRGQVLPTGLPAFPPCGFLQLTAGTAGPVPPLHVPPWVSSASAQVFMSVTGCEHSHRHADPQGAPPGPPRCRAALPAGPETTPQGLPGRGRSGMLGRELGLSLPEGSSLRDAGQPPARSPPDPGQRRQ